MSKYWIGVASLEHVNRGISGSFAQVCHGKQGPLKLMSDGDWIIYYSPTVTFGEKDLCRSFTAIGRISPKEPFLFQMSNDFTPWRREVAFLKAHHAPIETLLDQLSFIKDKKKWGFPFRRGVFEITKNDFDVIANAMGVNYE